MRLHSFLLLFAAVIATASSTATAESVGPITVPYPARLLRLHELPTDAEERGITVNTKQIDDWLEKGDTADDIFKLLSLHMKESNILANPKLDEWITYMKAFNKKFPKKQTSLVTTLTTHYVDDDLARMIQAAKKVPETAKIAKRLEIEQIYRWLEHQKTPKEVFNLLKLDDVTVEPFLQPQMLTWAKYIDYFDKANPGKKASLLPAFGYYDEESMVAMLIKAKTVPATEHLAVRAQVELTQVMLRHERTPSQIFTMLKFKEADDKLLENPLFIAWMKYTDDFNEMYPKKRQPAMTALLENFSGEKMAKMVLDAEKSPSVAKQLQSELMETWLKKKRNPARVFKLLKLNEAADKAFESPVLAMWLKYITFYKEANPKEIVNVAQILKMYHSDEALAKMLLEATKAPSTEKIALSTLDALTIGWMYRQKVRPEIVYKWLDAAKNDVGEKFYTSYRTLYNMKYPSRR
uniref:Avh148 n=1 Tax=Phytophthora sojae TaxID=67593 RepID=G1FRL3_PHYSO|nr:Avh148 [Phytophthora sojae]